MKSTTHTIGNKLDRFSIGPPRLVKTGENVWRIGHPLFLRPRFRALWFLKDYSSFHQDDGWGWHLPARFQF